MRIESGTTDKYIYFVAVDSTDFSTRETGLSSFTVYRSRNGAAAAAMTTPTINETDSTNMPGVYELLLDEDMTIDAGDISQEMVFHITATGMAPVTRTIELYKNDANVVSISGDTAAADNLEAMYDGTGYTDSNGPATQTQCTTIQNRIGVPTISLTYQIESQLAGDITTIDFVVDEIRDKVGLDLGTVTGTPTTTVFDVTLASATDDYYNGEIIAFENSALKGFTRKVTDYVGSTKTITVSPALPVAPSSGDKVFLASSCYGSSPEEVNAEVVDVLNTDTFAEPGQGAPGATISLAQKIGYLYKAWRNKSTQTSTTYSLFNDDTTTVDHKATVSDDGTTATKGETTTGP